MKPYYQDKFATIYHGDCRDVLPTLEPVGCVVTSPPYAEQRSGQYASVPEVDYPGFTLEWMNAVPLGANGNVLINILEHIRDGSLSGYVHETRRLIRASSWVERDELIWYKPDGGQVTGNMSMPARAFERILWFARDGKSYSDVKKRPMRSVHRFAGTQAGNIGGGGPLARRESVAGQPARIGSVIPLSVRANDGDDNTHPAAYPRKLASLLVAVFAPPASAVLDPFMGSGTTLVAAKELGRYAIGVELDEGHCETAARRLSQEVLDFGRSA